MTTTTLLVLWPLAVPTEGKKHKLKLVGQHFGYLHVYKHPDFGDDITFLGLSPQCNVAAKNWLWTLVDRLERLRHIWRRLEAQHRRVKRVVDLGIEWADIDGDVFTLVLLVAARGVVVVNDLGDPFKAAKIHLDWWGRHGKATYRVMCSRYRSTYVREYLCKLDYPGETLPGEEVEINCLLIVPIPIVFVASNLQLCSIDLNCTNKRKAKEPHSVSWCKTEHPCGCVWLGCMICTPHSRDGTSSVMWSWLPCCTTKPWI